MHMAMNSSGTGALIWGLLFLLAGGYVLWLSATGRTDEEKPDVMRIFSYGLGAIIALAGLGTALSTLPAFNG